MRTKAAYLVIDTYGRTPTISHVRASWPRLDPGQIVIRLAVEIPDSLLPQAQVVEIADPGDLAVVATLPVEPPEDEDGEG